MADERPIIIKRVKKIAAGSHGGAWKLAYADFVTAMMAFFLLMWLLGSVTAGDLKGIADYFQNPWKPSFIGGRGTGDTTKIISGGGEDLTRSVGQVKRTNAGKQNKTTVTAEEAEGSQNAQELINLQQAKQKLQDMINQNEMLHQYSQQFRIDITTEGLRIQIVDADKRPMFDLGSTQMQPYAVEIMRQISPVIDQLPNRISITGHTDSLPYSGFGRYYSNWELSTDRANAARRALVIGSVHENKFLRVVGLADSVPLNPSDPLDPTNRRISIIVMKRSAEQELIANSGPSVEVGRGATSPKQGDPLLFPGQPVQPKPFPSPIQPAQPLPARPGVSTQPSQSKPISSSAQTGSSTQTLQPKPFLAPGQPSAPVPSRPASTQSGSQNGVR